MEEIGQGLLQLEREHGINVEALGKDEAFIDTLMFASQSAMRNSQDEKRTALRNAVLNVRATTGNAVSEVRVSR